MDSSENKELQKYLRLFKYAYNNKHKYKKFKDEDESLYYSDVDGNRSQFTDMQLRSIREKYGVPISTKLAFPIIQQMLSFVTGSKPYPRLVSSEEPFKGFAVCNERMVHHVWYESEADDALARALEDMLVRGSGWLHVRPNSFYEESSLGTIVEYCRDEDVYIDPCAKDPGLKDADFVVIAKALPTVKAERYWNIKIEQTDGGFIAGDVNVPDSMIPSGYDDGLSDVSGVSNNYKTKFVWEKVFYEVLLTNSYISPDGMSCFEPPVPAVIPNEEKVTALTQLQQMRQQIIAKQAQEMTQMSSVDGDDVGTGAQGSMQSSNELSQLDQALKEVVALPDYIHGFNMTLSNGSVVFVEKYVVKQVKKVKRTIQVNARIVKQDILDTDILPVHLFSFAYSKNINNSFGVVHFIKDIIHALNKTWGLIVYDLQLRSSFRILTPRNAIKDPVTWEKHFSVPGSVNEYDGDPSLPNGGRPEVMDTGNINATLPQFISMLVNLAEYITGIFGVLQGNTEGAPGTFGATQSLQSFGTQRIKMVSRSIENALGGLVYSIVRSLQQTVTDENIATFFSDNPEMAEEFKFIGTDTRFKARMVITNSLPTANQMAAQMFTILAGQVQDPNVQRLLIESGIKFLDIKEADDLLAKLDTMQQMQSQVQQAQQENENLQAQLRAASNNLAQKDIAMQAEKSKIQIQEQAKKEMAINKMQAQMDTQTESGAEEEEPFPSPNQY